MSKTLYLECYSGISGDMTVAALLDLGADREVLKESLKSLPVGGFRTEITRVKKSGLDACDFSVILEQDNHDHDMEYLHGSEKSYTGHYEHSHEVNHEHHHGHFHHHAAPGYIADLIEHLEVIPGFELIQSKVSSRTPWNERNHRDHSEVGNDCKSKENGNACI